MVTSKSRNPFIFLVAVRFYKLNGRMIALIIITALFTLHVFYGMNVMVKDWAAFSSIFEISDLINSTQNRCGEPSNSTKKLLKTSGISASTLVVWPKWIQDLCPDVVEHFSHFPYYSRFIPEFGVMTSLYAGHSVCSMSVAITIAGAINTKIYIHAGSHLGAIVHGGPIPWDDDVDLFLAYINRDAFLRQCKSMANFYPNISLECIVAGNAIKLSVKTENSQKTRYRWYSPFVDIFLFQIKKGKIIEVSPSGRARRQSYNLNNYFPTRPFYFGGIYVIGPQEKISITRYNVSACKGSRYHHRSENPSVYRGTHIVDCCHLSRLFPFVYNNSYIFNGRTNKSLIDQVATEITFAAITWKTSLTKRKQWFQEPDTEGERLSNLLPNVSSIEVDNIHSTCNEKTNLTVLEFNAKGGTHWLHSVDVLKSLDADILILNEMDIGMARSDQQHTTRLLAYTLKMNYAWGMEFLELTRGSKEEQTLAEGMDNLLGLHGNAILSKCRISDPVIFRNKIGKYFSNDRSIINGNDYEKRLGGRMGLLSRVHIGNKEVVVGSVHKLDGYTDEIKKYIGQSKAVMGGSQSWNFCNNVGLVHIDNKSHATYPSSCQSTGNHRRDILCSNLKVLTAEETISSCIVKFGNKIQISDHSITSVSLSLN